MRVYASWLKEGEGGGRKDRRRIAIDLRLVWSVWGRGGSEGGGVLEIAEVRDKYSYTIGIPNLPVRSWDQGREYG